MPRDEVIPRAFAAPRSRIKPMLLEDVLDSVAREGLDAEFLEFAGDAGLSPRLILSGQAKNELPDVLPGLGRPRLAGLSARRFRLRAYSRSQRRKVVGCTMVTSS